VSEGPNTPGVGDPNAGNPPGGAPPPPQGGAPPPPQQQPPSAMPGAQTGVGQPADLMTRFLAKLIDWILVGIVLGVIIIPLTIGLAFSGGFGGGMPGMGGFSVGGIVTSVVMYGLAIGYFAFLESNKGQTLGKMLMKIEVQSATGGHPPIEQAFKRNLYMLLPIIPILGGLAYLGITIYIAVTINNNTTTRQGWHDEFADGTKVIKVG
jgi:uncharacterized RDD family membrane protein YckC